ncbi:MAG: peptide chain release factor aRF-1 [Candidatus Nanoarchaeia archaeon]
MEQAEKYELEETIQELEEYRGRHTELVTLYVPAGYNIHQVKTQVDEEKGTAENIKSKTTRKNVIEALEKISRQLKTFKKVPENGMAIFSGNVGGDEQSDVQIWIIEPPKPLNIKLYRCDQLFVLDPLKEMIETEEVYGLLIIDRKEATIGLLEGKQINVLQELTSGVPGSMRAGGQSSQRFERLIDEKAKSFFRRVSETMKKHFFEKENLKGILIGGPVPTKEEFLESGNLTTSLKNKVLAMKDIGDTGKHGLETLVSSSEDILAEQEITRQKHLLDKFFETLAKEPDKVTYGEQEVQYRLQEGSVDKLILSKSLSKDKRKHFEELAKQTSAEVHIVTNETSQGVQFDNLGGIAGLLRFAIPT